MCNFNPLRKVQGKFPIFVVISVVLVALLTGCPDPVQGDTVSPPTQMVAPTLEVGNGQLTANWISPADNGGEITAYHVQHKLSTADWPTDDSTDTDTIAHTATNHVITGLANAQSYDVRVRAVNKAGAGDWSPPATETPDGTLPTAPTTFMLEVGDEMLTATWEAPTNLGASGNIDRYEVQYRKTGAGEWSNPILIDLNADPPYTYRITGLTNGTEYEVQVYAVSEITAHYPEERNGNSAIDTATPATTPSAPTALTLSPGNTQLSASWSAPTDTGGSAVTAYHLRYRTGGGAWTEISSGIGTSHHTITGLMNSTTYDVQVSAVNAQGAGDWSPPATETPDGTLPTAPNEFMLAVSLQTITATWEAPTNTGDSAITRYELQHRVAGASAWEPAIATADADTLTLIITGLTNGTEYEVRVYAVNGQGNGNPATDTATTPIGPPAMLNAPRLAVGDTQLTATWTAPNDGGSPITSYDVQYSSDNGSNWTLVTDPIAGTAASYTITGLTNDGTSYDVQVRAKNAVLEDAGNGAGIGDWSASATRTLLPLATQIPKVPSGGTPTSVILSAAIDDAIANAENPSVTVAGITSGTSVTLPTVDSSTGVITVSASTTAGIYVIYVIYGETENGDKLLFENFSVTMNPADNAALKAAVNTGISNWGNTADFNYIITTAVTDMSGIFGYKGAFNGDISLWNTAAVTNMSGMFIVARTFNGDISDWDVSKVTNMSVMFSDATAFNGDISNWDVSKVTNMSLIFGGAYSFNRDISGWGDVSKVTDMSKMFKNARSFNQDISGWTIAATPNMTEMFDGARAFSQNLDAWGDHLTLNTADTPKYEGSDTNMFRNSGVGTGMGQTAFPSWYAE